MTEKRDDRPIFFKVLCYAYIANVKMRMTAELIPVICRLVLVLLRAYENYFVNINVYFS